MRLIDADALKDDVYEKAWLVCDTIKKIIDNAPTVKPKKGHWERTDKYTGFAYMSYIKCSECGVSMPNIYADDFKFCPNCGADMR